MIRRMSKACLALTGALLAGSPVEAARSPQERKTDERFAVNTKFGVQITIPLGLPKDQRELWEAVADKEGKFFKDPAVAVQHKVDHFRIEVTVQELEEGKRWSELPEIAKNARENFTQTRPDGTPANFKECTLRKEDPRSKLLRGLTTSYMYQVQLVDLRDRKVDLWEWFCIHNNDLIRVTLLSDEENFKKYFDREGRTILMSLRRCKKDKK
ncbi:MAG: hypothetical protein HY716_11445 [Planctomycetes bacterium]|nr:hypothetical protein [Planctomycetota bacterium]